MRNVIVFSVEILLACAVGILCVGIADVISIYRYAGVATFFFGSIVSFYGFEYLTKKIFRL